MSVNRKTEDRALNKDERVLVASTHHPEIQDLDDKELASRIRLVRERRDRARSEKNRRKREMRGKAAPKGGAASTSNTGNKAKLEVLASALRRLNGERTRRERMGSQVELSRKALALVGSADASDGAPENTRHAHQGMLKAASQRRQDLIRPMERGRLRKAAAVAQARRDAR